MAQIQGSTLSPSHADMRIVKFMHAHTQEYQKQLRNCAKMKLCRCVHFQFGHAGQNSDSVAVVVAPTNFFFACFSIIIMQNNNDDDGNKSESKIALNTINSIETAPKLSNFQLKYPTIIVCFFRLRREAKRRRANAFLKFPSFSLSSFLFNSTSISSLLF